MTYSKLDYNDWNSIHSDTLTVIMEKHKTTIKITPTVITDSSDRESNMFILISIFGWVEDKSVVDRHIEIWSCIVEFWEKLGQSC